jgi:NAD(P)H-binding
VTGDLEEPDTLAQAFDGVNILFLLTPASALEPSMGSNAVTAARKAKVGHIVRNSAIKAGHDAPNRNGRLHALHSEGWGDFVTSDFREITGMEARSLKQFATDFALVFGGAAVLAAHA